MGKRGFDRLTQADIDVEIASSQEVELLDPSHQNFSPSPHPQAPCSTDVCQTLQVSRAKLYRYLPASKELKEES
jgi:hypothetical protein